MLFNFSTYVTALRPRQWTKNCIIFAAPLFAFQVTIETVFDSLLTFVLFCCLSSAFYLINDCIDYEADRAHPIKCHRPIASGKVKLPIAIFLSILLLLFSLGIGFLKTPLLGIVLLLYAFVQLAYNLYLKQIPILDLFSISSGFILRAYSGAIVNDITLSPWFVLCTAMLALFLAIEKRKAELGHQITYQITQAAPSKPTRKVLKYYSVKLLDRMETIVTTTTVISYALWSSGPQLKGASTPWMLMTLPFVIYGVFRYQMLSEGLTENAGELTTTERPEEMLLRDRALLLTVIGWIVCCMGILILKSRQIMT